MPYRHPDPIDGPTGRSLWDRADQVMVGGGIYLTRSADMAGRGVQPGFIFHLQHANQARADDTASDYRVGSVYQNIQWIAVFAQGVRDIAVCAGVEHGCCHEAVDEQGTGVLVDFILDRVAVRRNFDNYIDFIGSLAARANIYQTHGSVLTAVLG